MDEALPPALIQHLYSPDSGPMNKTSVGEKRPQTSPHSTIDHASLQEQPRPSTDPLQPFCHSFFDKDLESKRARFAFLKQVCLGVLSIVFVIFLILSIFWGALHNTPYFTYRLNGIIVDFDGGIVASATSSAFQAYRTRLGDKALSWTVLPGSEFPGGPSEVAEAIRGNKYWAAIVVNSGSTQNLTRALENPAASTSYDGMNAITVFVNEARNENAYRVVIRPGIETPMAAFLAQFSLQNTKTIAARSNVGDILTNVPQVFSAPVGYTLVNLIPFDIPVATAMTFVGLIYIVILSFMLTNLGAGAREASGLAHRLTLRSILMLRLISPFIMYFFVSLFYSLLSLAFQVPFTRHYGKSGFLIYWMLSWLAMLALGLSLESMLTLLTIKFVSYYLVVLIIINVSVAFLPIELLPAIFRYGYASPFYNVSSAVRAILFGTRDQLGLNFGILIGWTLVSCVTLSIFTWWRWRMAVKSERQKRANRDA